MTCCRDGSLIASDCAWRLSGISKCCPPRRQDEPRSSRQAVAETILTSEKNELRGVPVVAAAGGRRSWAGARRQHASRLGG